MVDGWMSGRTDRTQRKKRPTYTHTSRGTSYSIIILDMYGLVYTFIYVCT